MARAEGEVVCEDKDIPWSWQPLLGKVRREIKLLMFLVKNYMKLVVEK